MFFQLQKACMLEIALNDIFNQFLSRDAGWCCGWAEVWINTEKWRRCPTLNKARGEISYQAAWLLLLPYTPSFFFLTKLCFVWFVVQYLHQSEFPSIVYQFKQQKLKKSWCFSSWRHTAASHPTVADPSSQKALNRGTQKHFLLKSMCNRFNVLPLWEWVSHDANIYFHMLTLHCH